MIYWPIWNEIQDTECEYCVKPIPTHRDWPFGIIGILARWNHHDDDDWILCVLVFVSCTLTKEWFHFIGRSKGWQVCSLGSRSVWWKRCVCVYFDGVFFACRPFISPYLLHWPIQKETCWTLMSERVSSLLYQMSFGPDSKQSMERYVLYHLLELGQTDGIFSNIICICV